MKTVNVKRLEELKEIANKDWEERCRLTFKLENSISKDKIREKIDFYKDRKKEHFTNYSTIDELILDKKIEVLQEFLEE